MHAQKQAGGPGEQHGGYTIRVTSSGLGVTPQAAARSCSGVTESGTGFHEFPPKGTRTTPAHGDSPRQTPEALWRWLCSCTGHSRSRTAGSLRPDSTRRRDRAFLCRHFGGGGGGTATRVIKNNIFSKLMKCHSPHSKPTACQTGFLQDEGGGQARGSRRQNEGRSPPRHRALPRPTVTQSCDPGTPPGRAEAETRPGPSRPG